MKAEIHPYVPQENFLRIRVTSEGSPGCEALSAKTEKATSKQGQAGHPTEYNST